MLSILRALNNTPNRLGIMLNHEYTIDSLTTNGVRALKGRDNDWFNMLKEANDKLETSEKMCFQIAQAEYEVGSYYIGGR